MVGPAVASSMPYNQMTGIKEDGSFLGGAAATTIGMGLFHAYGKKAGVEWQKMGRNRHRELNSGTSKMSDGRLRAEAAFVVGSEKLGKGMTAGHRALFGKGKGVLGKALGYGGAALVGGVLGEAGMLQ